MKTDLEKLHSTLVEILDYVYGVCEEHGLTCLLVYGTALGAYRHDGFIPWDDDVDVAMPRDDYNKFLQIMKEKKDDLFELQNEDNEKNYFLGFAKVRKKNTVFIESIAEKLYQNNGIYIDIFPLEYVENPNTVGYKLKQILIEYLLHILRVSACKELYKQKKGRLGYCLEWLISLPAMIIPRKKLVKMLNAAMAGKTPREKANYLAQYDTARSGQVMPYSTYLPAKKHIYEGKYYNIPNEIEAYLTRIYGDTFMELPPEEKRHTHEPIELKF